MQKIPLEKEGERAEACLFVLLRRERRNFIKAGKGSKVEIDKIASYFPRGYKYYIL